MAASAMFPEKEVRLVLIGKTGNGKSSAGNTILGGDHCKPNRGMTSGTDKCDWHAAYRDGIRIQVTDTPGVCDTHKSKEEVQREIAKSMATCSPGPHAILMVLRCDRRFTDEEYQAYQELKVLFGRELTTHMVLIFNGLDELEQGGSDLATELKKVPPKLRHVLGESGGRYIGFNNQVDWNRRYQQGGELLDMVFKMVAANKGRHFTNDLVQQMEEKIQEEMEAEDISRREINDKIIKEKDPSFLGILINVLTFGLVPKHVCRLS